MKTITEGSEKQISFANTLRNQYLEDKSIWLGKMEERGKITEPLYIERKSMLEAILNCNNAGNIIHTLQQQKGGTMTSEEFINSLK